MSSIPLACIVCIIICISLAFNHWTHTSVVVGLRPVHDNTLICPDASWGRILQQYLDKVTLDLSKEWFFTLVFLAFCIHETKVRNVQFHHFSLEI